MGKIIGEGAIQKFAGKKRKIVVGDRTAIAFVENGILPDVIIYDHKEKRKRICKTRQNFLDAVPFRTIEVANRAGTIQEELWTAIKESKKERTKILVHGEEDLAAIPAALEMRGVLFYGQPEKGIVAVPITGKIKARAKKMLDQMKVVM